MDLTPPSQQSNLSNLKVNELKQLLETRGLSTRGLKKDLVERLQDAMMDVKIEDDRSGGHGRGTGGGGGGGGAAGIIDGGVMGPPQMVYGSHGHGHGHAHAHAHGHGIMMRPPQSSRRAGGPGHLGGYRGGPQTSGTDSYYGHPSGMVSSHDSGWEDVAPKQGGRMDNRHLDQAYRNDRNDRRGWHQSGRGNSYGNGSSDLRDYPMRPAPHRDMRTDDRSRGALGSRERYREYDRGYERDRYFRDSRDRGSRDLSANGHVEGDSWGGRENQDLPSHNDRRSSYRKRSRSRSRTRSRSPSAYRRRRYRSPSPRSRSRRHDRDSRRTPRQDRFASSGRDFRRDRRGSDRELPRHVTGRKRSSSPRSPSPPAADVDPLDRWLRKHSNWDIPPEGYEGMTAEQVKATGLFPLPCHLAVARLSGVNPASLIPGVQASMSGSMHELPPKPPPMLFGKAPANTLPSSRQARRLYVGNLPSESTEESLMRLFNTKMKEYSLCVNDNEKPVIAVQINHEKSYAFVEFSEPQEATNAMAFDGLEFLDNALRVRRPKDFHQSMSTDFSSKAKNDSPNKIYIGGLPTVLTDDQIKELLESFGELKHFHLVRDAQTNMSKGYAFCEYSDPNVTDLACQGLNNMELGDKRLLVQRATAATAGGSSSSHHNAGMTSRNNQGAPMPLLPPSAYQPGAVGEPTNTLLLLNMLAPEDLMDENEVRDIVRDIGSEASKHGMVTEVRIPKPNRDPDELIGKVYIRFKDPQDSAKALQALAGRRFNDRAVFGCYVQPEKYPFK